MPNEYGIWVITAGAEEKFLRQKTVPLNPTSQPKKELNNLIKHMNECMKRAHGIGLSANQIGLSHRLFVARVPGMGGSSKQYTIFNPAIEKQSKETVFFEEGCLSVPGVYGSVERPDRITISGQDKQGKPIKIKAWGLVARVFQHEIDHLNGYLFIDRTKDVHKEPESVRLKKRQEKMEEKK